MNKRRVFVFLWSAFMAWVIVNAYLAEERKRGEMIALCAFQPAGPSAGVPLENFVAAPAPNTAKATVRWIADVTGISPNFDIMQSDAAREFIAFAAIKDGRRIIVYDPARFIWSGGQVRWRDLGIIAHEIGHHIAGHTAVAMDHHAREIEADRFAGFAAAMLGASYEQALAYAGSLSEEETATHPARAVRKVAIGEGWRHGERIRRNGGLACASGWMGDSLTINGEECRLARRCSSGLATVALACRAGETWLWRPAP